MVKVIIRDEYYDYFGGQKNRIYKYSTLLEGWREYMRMKSNVFTYDDSYYRVYISLCVPTRENKPQRPHARSRDEWENMVACQEYNDNRMFDDEEIAYLLSNVFDIDDEEIMI